MKILYVFVLIPLMTWVVYDVYSFKPRPPSEHTGAPGENTCIQCHVGSTVNDGVGQVSINFNNPINNYELNKTYRFHIKSERPSLSIYGFEVVAVAANTSENVGQITILDTIRTQLFTSADLPSERMYIGHTIKGIIADTIGENNWSFDWTAPNTDVGQIKFYVASVASNNSNSRFGDNVYTTNLTLDYLPSAIFRNKLETNFNLLYDYSNAQMTYTIAIPSYVDITLWNVNGIKVKKIVSEFQSGNICQSVDLTDVESGLYFLKFNSKNYNTTIKIQL